MRRFSPKLTFLQYFTLALIVLIAFAGRPVEESTRKKNLTWLQQHQEAAKTTVLLNNKKGFLPIQDLSQKIASVNLGTTYAVQFDSLLNKYAAVTSFSAAGFDNDSLFNRLQDELKFYHTILVQLPEAALQDKVKRTFLEQLQQTKQLVLSVYGSRQGLAQAEGFTAPIIWAEKESPVTAQFAAQAIFGGVPLTGKLDKTYSANYQKGTGFATSAIRLKYSIPEEVGINTQDLVQPIDAIVAEAIQQQATPGAVVMVVKDGKVIFNKAYGSHTYDNSRPTQITDIFDLASVTKVSATTMAVMQLYDQKKVNLTGTLGSYIPSARNTSKANLTLKDILLHQSGLPAGVNLPVSAKDAQRTPSDYYTVQAADSFFLRKDYYKEVMWPRMLNAKMATPGKYVYSDITMYLIKEVVERQSEEPLDAFVMEHLYRPLGMQTAGFLPLQRFQKDRIVPTEDDTYFRKTLLQGYVHDGGAARLGGVSGHAGLFSTANDMAILYQMMLNRGTYGGKEYFKPSTVDLFTAKQSGVSRRGLGFDRWDPDSSKGYPSKLASPATYGHTGYTGTCVWVDPAQNLVYIFLSNRVYPKVSNKLLSLNIRPRIQDAIYAAIKKGNPTSVSQ
jgi:serine-type D-Ala-D-Ala carboxypeptidase